MTLLCPLANHHRSVQIALPDDPGFDLDVLQLPAFDFNAVDGTSLLSQSRQESWSNMSAPSRQSNKSQQLQIVLDADSSGPRSYASAGFGGYSASAASNVQDSPIPHGRPQLGLADDDDNTLLPDVGLFIDENGNIVEEELHSEPQLPAFPPSLMRAGSAAAAKAPKQGTHGDDAATGGNENEEELNPMVVDDDGQIIPAAQLLTDGPDASASASAATAAAAKAAWQHPASSSQMLSSPSAVSSKRAHQRAQRGPNFVDEITQIPLSEYFKYVTNYGDNMQRATERRDRARAARRANDAALNRDMAYDTTLGRGLFAVANDVEEHCRADHPLVQMFSGEALEQMLFGGVLAHAEAKRRKTAAAVPSTPVQRRGIGEDQDIELGRQPASALSDNPSLQLQRHSSLLPGGGSSAHGSVQRSAGLGRQPSGTAEQASAGRSRDPSFIERYSDEGLDLPAQLMSNSMSNSLSNSLDGLIPPLGSSPPPTLAPVADAEGGMMRDTAEFLQLIQTTAADEGMVRRGQHAKTRWVAFDHVVSSVKQSRPAVVGAFMSLLTLASARKLRVHQAEDKDHHTIDREILVGVKVPKKSKKRSFQEMSGAKDVNDVASLDDLRSGHVFPDAMEVEQAR